MNIFGLAAATTAALIISGCASLENLASGPSPQQINNWHLNETQLNKIERWSFSARFSARTESDAWNGELSWSQDKDSYQIRISGPLNQGTAMLSGDQHHAELAVSDQETWTDTDAASLLKKHLGVSFPVDGLRYWVRGLPTPAQENRMRLDEQGSIDQLNQNGWVIRYKNYVVVDNTRLPQKIFLEQNNIQVRLVLDQWQIRSS